ncbi:MAG: hypothetical protein HC942_01960 [Microcoleus sp. SU_5_6]|nr:hypothetical protein [Microcoleus sp. SU_5_6]
MVLKIGLPIGDFRLRIVRFEIGNLKISTIYCNLSCAIEREEEKLRFAIEEKAERKKK